MADTPSKPPIPESCANCKNWKEMSRSKRSDPVQIREGVCQGKFQGDYVTGHQYCLGFHKW